MPKQSKSIALSPWEQIREAYHTFAESAKRAAMDYITMGKMLCDLKEAEYHTNGGDRTEVAQKKLRWTQDLHEQVGLSRQTADRYIADYQRYTQIKQIADGIIVEDEIILYDGTKKQRKLGERESERTKAKEILAAVQSNEVRPSRAWAGLTGFDNGGMGGKAAANRYRLMERSIKTLRGSWKEWDQLSGKQQENLAELFSDMMKSAPNKLL